jgi:beta-lactamase superfamily II metal-dependent hydrolase
MRTRTIALAVALLLVGPALWASATLVVHFIDVEGGQVTLIVTPAGQTLLIDAGFPALNGRDPDRIMAAIRHAGVTRIDYLLVTHFHEDHDGGVGELARRIPIGTFVDYGAPIETAPEVVAAFSAYQEARSRGRHLVPQPGDRLPLEAVDVEVVSAAGATLARPLSGAGQPNGACEPLETRSTSLAENPRSIGVRIRYGAFRLLDLGDLACGACSTS